MALQDIQRASLAEREGRRSCGDDGPTITGAPEGWWEAACARVAAEQARMREDRSAAFYEGYGSFAAGEPLSHAPRVADTSVSKDWRAGWFAAYEQEAAKPVGRRRAAKTIGRS